MILLLIFFFNFLNVSASSNNLDNYPNKKVVLGNNKTISELEQLVQYCRMPGVNLNDTIILDDGTFCVELRPLTYAVGIGEKKLVEELICRGVEVDYTENFDSCSVENSFLLRMIDSRIKLFERKLEVFGNSLKLEIERLEDIRRLLKQSSQ